MAKTPRTRRARGGQPARRRWPAVLGVLAVILAGLGWYFRGPIFGYSEIAAAYSARVACSCRFVAGRSLDSCATDKMAGMELVTLSEDDAAKSVTARFPLLASETATLRKGYGCVLQRWKD